MTSLESLVLKENDDSRIIVLAAEQPMPGIPHNPAQQ